jgi:hypothetical protein
MFPSSKQAEAAPAGVEREKLRALVEVDLKAVEQALDAAGAPWTPGRVPAR